MRIDKIIWLDGHTTTIPSEDADRKMTKVVKNNNTEWHLKLNNSEFIWKSNCWMQIK